jgi:S-adenosylmethionine/arginine decarboxylase-like enzyme
VALHNHILLNGHVKNPPRDTEEAIEWLRQLVSDIDMKVIQGPYSSYVDVPGNRGLTAAVMIETSHIAFHVWDEEDPALLQFDLYTCSTLPIPIVIESIDKWMQFVDYNYIVYERATGFNVIEEKSYVNQI